MPRALLLDKKNEALTVDVREVETSQLPDGDVVLDVLYSSLNYKDALAVTGRGKIIRGSYPFVPGIDLVGRVQSSESARFTTGARVIGTGWGLGEERWGGFSEVQRVDADQLVGLPDRLSDEASMVAGTAGLTAMLSVIELEARGIRPGGGAVVVTGASGGVGSLAVAFLAAAGFEVVASTGSKEAKPYLERLGAARIVDRAELSGAASRPLDSARWAGAVDVVGGKTLEALLSQMDRHGAVACCGLAGGADVHTTVFPFILRGVALIGIDSNTCPNDLRRAAWERIADVLSDKLIQEINTRTIGLDAVEEVSNELLAGNIHGRIVVDVHQ